MNWGIRCLLVWLLMGMTWGDRSLIFAQKSDLAETMSVEDLPRNQKELKKLVGRTMKIDGRLSYLGTEELRFKKCEIKFALKSPAKGSPGRLEGGLVVGKFVENEGQVEFQVEGVQFQPNDLNQLEQLKRLRKLNDPNDMRFLADWAYRRAKFYGDQKLEEKGVELYRKWIRLEWNKVGLEDGDAVLELSRKSDMLQLGESLRQELMHDAIHRYLRKERQRETPEFERILELAGQGLPETHRVIEEVPEALDRKYKGSPVPTYNQASAEDRLILNRLLFVDVSRLEMEQRGVRQKWSGFEVADQLEEAIPELKEYAQKLRETTINNTSSKLKQLSRGEMVEFASAVERVRGKEKGNELKRIWLGHRESDYRKNGAAGLAEYAEEFVSLLQDETTAARYYIEAQGMDRNLKLTSDWLTAHGYVAHEGRWVQRSTLKTTQETEIEAAINRGVIIEGMKGEHVLRVHGPPTTKTRMASTGKMVELWHYRELQLSVMLTRRQFETESLVTRVSRLQP